MARPERDQIQLLDEIARLLALQVRLSTQSQSQAISELNKAGLGPSRIAELLGTSSNTVQVTIQRAKRRKASGPADSGE